MEAVLRYENDVHAVHVDALTVVDFTMLYVTGYMSEGWTMGGGGGWGKSPKKKISPGTKPRNTRISPATQARSNITRIVIVRVNTLLNVSTGSKVFFIQVSINQSRLY